MMSTYTDFSYTCLYFIHNFNLLFNPKSKVQQQLYFWKMQNFYNFLFLLTNFVISEVDNLLMGKLMHIVVLMQWCLIWL